MSPTSWMGICVGCYREGVEVASRRTHGERVLCERCASRPYRLPTAPGLHASHSGKTLARTAQPGPGTPERGATVKASAVALKRQRWLWQGRLLLGSVSLLVGKEGVGKSTVTAWLAARITHGELPGQLYGKPSSVLLVASEDDIAEVWKPRLVLARADLDRVDFLDMDRLGPGWNVSKGIDDARTAVKRAEAALVVIDAILDHLPQPKAGEGANSPTFVRAALAPLKHMARELNVCVPLGMHPPKGVRVEYRDMVQASQAFTAVARTGLLIAWHPDDEHLPEDDRRRVILRGKGNYGRNPGGTTFRIASGFIDLDDGGPPLEHGYVTDVQQTALTMTDLVPRRDLADVPDSKIDRACAFVAEKLADGEWHHAGALCAELDDLGLGGKSRTADLKRRLKIETEHSGYPAAVHWRLPLRPTNPQTRKAPRARSNNGDGPSGAEQSRTPLSIVEGLRVCDLERAPDPTVNRGPEGLSTAALRASAHEGQMLTPDELVEALLADPDLGALEITADGEARGCTVGATSNHNGRAEGA